MTTMETIHNGLKSRKHKPKDAFVEAIYTLFFEFRDAYRKEEWPRLDACERMYQGDHWYDVSITNPKEPKPTTPILFSTIENIRADLADEFPEAIIRPEDVADKTLAKVLTEVVRQNLEACDYEKEYDALTHDLLVGGWAAQEVGWNFAANAGLGGAFIRHVPNKNVLFDPCCVDMQEGRAVFKFDKLPSEWFRQHYPDMYARMTEDVDVLEREHDAFENTVRSTESAYNILIEAWFRLYDAAADSYVVHMVKLAGGCVLESSCDIKTEGYFRHGMYPFIVTPLFDQKGTGLGLGIVDMFRNAQQYSDKIDQIILKNALTAGHNRFLVMEESVDVDDLRDYSKEVITTSAPPNSVMSWIQDRPLPPHIVGYMQQMRESIKEESGTNDFSRGKVNSGVTAASAITALQEMSGKRSRMEARRVHYGFKQAVRMLLEVVREFDNCPRKICVTVEGEPRMLMVGGEMFRRLEGGDIMPIEFAVSIKAVRETRFSRISNNQMVLEFLQLFKGMIDPAVLLEAMAFEGQEVMLEKLRAAQTSGMQALQRQAEEMGSALKKAEKLITEKVEETETLRQALRAAQKALGAGMHLAQAPLYGGMAQGGVNGAGGVWPQAANARPVHGGGEPGQGQRQDAQGPLHVLPEEDAGEQPEEVGPQQQGNAGGQAVAEAALRETAAAAWKKKRTGARGGHNGGKDLARG